MRPRRRKLALLEKLAILAAVVVSVLLSPIWSYRAVVYASYAVVLVVILLGSGAALYDVMEHGRARARRRR